jgi:hypothetical protein
VEKETSVYGEAGSAFSVEEEDRLSLVRGKGGKDEGMFVVLLLFISVCVYREQNSKEICVEFGLGWVKDWCCYCSW